MQCAGYLARAGYPQHEPLDRSEREPDKKSKTDFFVLERTVAAWTTRKVGDALTRERSQLRQCGPLTEIGLASPRSQFGD